MQQGGAEGKQAVGKEGQLSGANFGPKYEAHVQEMQKQLDDSRSRWVCLVLRLLGTCTPAPDEVRREQNSTVAPVKLTVVATCPYLI